MDVQYKALNITMDNFEFAKEFAYFVTVQTDCSTIKVALGHDHL
jgi:hypothetical protein